MSEETVKVNTLSEGGRTGWIYSNDKVSLLGKHYISSEHLEVSLNCTLGHTIRIPPCRPPILPSALRTTMNQQKRRPFLLVILVIPLRFQNPPLDLLFCTIEIEFLSSVQVLTLQILLGELRELANRERLGFEVLGIVIPGIV